MAAAASTPGLTRVNDCGKIPIFDRWAFHGGEMMNYTPRRFSRVLGSRKQTRKAVQKRCNLGWPIARARVNEFG